MTHLVFTKYISYARFGSGHNISPSVASRGSEVIVNVDDVYIDMIHHAYRLLISQITQKNWYSEYL